VTVELVQIRTADPLAMRLQGIWGFHTRSVLAHEEAHVRVLEGAYSDLVAWLVAEPWPCEAAHLAVSWWSYRVLEPRQLWFHECEDRYNEDFSVDCSPENARSVIPAGRLGYSDAEVYSDNPPPFPRPPPDGDVLVIPGIDPLSQTQLRAAGYVE